MPDTKETWTLMFYFASDNPLAPGIVSQLKSLKNAGFSHQVNVVAQFDPHTPDTPTHIFDVNRVNKLKNKRDNIGFASGDPFIRNLVLDKLWGKETDAKGALIKDRLIKALEAQGIVYQAPEPLPYPPATSAQSGKEKENEKKTATDVRSDEPSPAVSLTAFLEFCAREYRADHYMLFIIGHGLVVGNDMFLYDADATEDSLSLRNLRKVLEGFVKSIGKPLELLGMHSCSMSSLEVTYELNNLAKYMIASQGPAFVGSWPYREILIRLFKNQAGSVAVSETVERIFDYVLYNSYDFQLAGYSFDLCLSKLDKDLDPLTKEIGQLSDILVQGLKKENKLARQLIILAHWDAQSYWQETYTDLYDFCYCLYQRCSDTLKVSKGAEKILTMMATSCKAVCTQLSKEGASVFPEFDMVLGDDTTSETPVVDLIVRSEFAGPESQYSHGVSVYFPWSEPMDHDFWPSAYSKYEFNATRWDKFLTAYFVETRRDPVRSQLPLVKGSTITRAERSIQEELLEEITCKIFNTNGPLVRSAGTLSKPGGGSGMGDDDSKPGGGSGTGIGCGCPSIKNYPSFTIEPGKQDEKGMPKPSPTGSRQFFFIDE